MCMTWCIVLFRNRLTEMLVVVQKEDFPPQQEPLSITFSPDMGLCYHTHFIFIVSLTPLSLFCIT